ncbi:hypothetical protein ABEX41_08620 [Bacillus tropicus]|uniref:Uncharacterized protein n=1 Tax=Bacillus tropicus TaxID=2026188 RepID=A0A5C5A2U4_9BACI|nr:MULTISPECIES: hypothetical protein [Bacillus]ALL24084.1 hypothetical protein BTXL6_22695 [Bacillus thuringiensis]EEM21033.1 NADH dehydrogenase subunit 6 [Bacillus thuringiensis serovar tochigiensis BGSC 4Y1]TNP13507.1 hypothetical protein FHY71_18340 [Bacillus tropicus]UBM50788.1 hypothetical protein K8M08_01110 [Bacillus sp. CRB-7]
MWMVNMWEQLWSYLVENGPVLAFTGTMITLLVNLFTTRKDKKKSLRAFISTDLILGNFALNGYHYEKGSKLFITKKYGELRDELDKLSLTKEELSKIPCSFLKVKNITSNHCFGPKVEVNIISESKEIKSMMFDIYMLQANEEVYIPLLSDDEDQFTETIKVTYSTLANEVMTYKSKVIREDGQLEQIIESVYVKGWFRNKAVITSLGSNSKWKVLN